MMLFRVIPGRIVPSSAGVEITFPVTMKMLDEESSSMNFLVATSKNRTSENPLALA